MLRLTLTTNIALNSITVLCLAIFTQTLYSLKPKGKAMLLYTLVSSLISGIPSTFLNGSGGSLKLLVNFIVMLLFLKLLFKISFLRCFTALGLFVIIQAVGNVIASVTFYVLGVDYISAKNELGKLLVANLIINIVNVLVFVFMRAFKLFSNFSIKVKTRAFIFIGGYIAFIIIIIAVNFSYYYNIYKRYVDGYGLIINVILVIGYFIFCIIGTGNFIHLEIKKQELEYQIFYNRTMDSLMSDLRRFKHNYNNMLGVVAGYLDSESTEELKEYLGQIVEENRMSNSSNNLRLMNIKNAGLLGLCAEKLEHAGKHQINFNVKVVGEIREVSMKISQLCEILGILLDNAIEAASESGEKFVNLHISSEDCVVSFTIENSVAGELRVDEIFKKGYSTKGEGRGMGLWIARNIVDKHSNVLLNTGVERNRFKQELIIS